MDNVTHRDFQESISGLSEFKNLFYLFKIIDNADSKARKLEIKRMERGRLFNVKSSNNRSFDKFGGPQIQVWC